MVVSRASTVARVLRPRSQALCTPTLRCDVNPRHRPVAPTTCVPRSLIPSATYLTTASSTRTSTYNVRQSLSSRTLPLNKHTLRRTYHNMSNNAELELGKVFDVKDKIALVTGGGSGIGLMITQTLAVNGAKVYIVGRTEEKLERVVEVHGKGIAGQIIPIVGDVASKEGVQQILKEIESREKYLDILVNNAGVAGPKANTSDQKTAEEARKEFFDTTTVEQWTDMYATNVVGPYLMTTAFLPLLQKSTDTHHGWSGTVVNITSISGTVRISQGHFAYNSSKGAQIHLNKLLAAEIAKAGLKIRVNSIAPGVFPSEMTTQESNEHQKSHMPKEQKEGLPSQRPGRDRDMAAAILFTVSCQYLNGQSIAVDGGYLIQAGT